MRFVKRINIKGLFCLALTVILCALSLFSCAEAVKDPVMECEGESISLEMYEFILSRTKGTLARRGIDVSATSSFWGEIHGSSGLTNEQYYNKVAAETCKNYLAALAIFSEEGMTLSESRLKAIDTEIQFYIDYDGQGSVEKLDKILAKYGTSTEGLRKIYEIEAKYNAVLETLYGSDASQISDGVKDRYYRENYYRFKRIVITDFYYEYQTDEESGEVIYFNPDSGKPIYDEDGAYHYDENGDRIVDSYGVAIRYDADGKPLYDKENGIPVPTKDENQQPIEHKYSPEEMAERVSKIDGIVAAAANENYAAFESEMPNWLSYVGAGEYCPDGFYLSDIESGVYDDTMDSILSALKEMQNGDVKVIEGDGGYHIIMKYPLDKGKYNNTEYAQWFAEFDTSLTSKLFRDRCGQYLGSITENEENLAKARSIKSIGQNYDY